MGVKRLRYLSIFSAAAIAVVLGIFIPVAPASAVTAGDSCNEGSIQADKYVQNGVTYFKECVQITVPTKSGYQTRWVWQQKSVYSPIAVPSQSRVVPKDQAPLSIKFVGTPVAGKYVTIAPGGGSGTGVISFSILGPCSKTAALGGSIAITSSAPGICFVTAAKNADSVYKAASSNTLAVTFTK